jgi:hypothetical protein
MVLKCSFPVRDFGGFASASALMGANSIDGRGGAVSVRRKIGAWYFM